MALCDELEELVKKGCPGSGFDEICKHMAKCAMFFYRHGPALLAMVEDAERYKHCRDATGMEGFWIAHGKFGEGCSRWNGEAADKAIDKARAGK